MQVPASRLLVLTDHTVASTTQVQQRAGLRPCPTERTQHGGRLATVGTLTGPPCSHGLAEQTLHSIRIAQCRPASLQCEEQGGQGAAQGRERAWRAGRRLYLRRDGRAGQDLLQRVLVRGGRLRGHNLLPVQDEHPARPGARAPSAPGGLLRRARGCALPRPGARGPSGGGRRRSRRRSPNPRRQGRAPRPPCSRLAPSDGASAREGTSASRTPHGPHRARPRGQARAAARGARPLRPGARGRRPW